METSIISIALVFTLWIIMNHSHSNHTFRSYIVNHSMTFRINEYISYQISQISQIASAPLHVIHSQSIFQSNNDVISKMVTTMLCETDWNKSGLIKCIDFFFFFLFMFCVYVVNMSSVILCVCRK